MDNRNELPDFDTLDRIAARTKLSDARISGRIATWGKTRFFRVIDEIAVAYRLGYTDGKRSNKERVAKAFAKIYPSQHHNDDADLEQNDDDVITPNGNTEVE